MEVTLYTKFINALVQYVISKRFDTKMLKLSFEIRKYFPKSVSDK